MSIIFIICLVVFGIFLAILFSPSNLKATINFSPFLPTSKKEIRQALRIAKLKPGETIFDLGCGDGRALVIAQKEFGAKVIGYELSKPFFIISKINAWLNKVKGGIFCQNFLEADLSKADIIFFFLTPKAIAKLQTKLETELKIGARVISISSPLPFWQAKSTTPYGKYSNIYYYHKTTEL